MFNKNSIVINKTHRTLYILVFKRSSDRNENFRGVKEDGANQQYESIIKALKADAPGRLNRLTLWQGGVVQ